MVWQLTSEKAFMTSGMKKSGLNWNLTDKYWNFDLLLLR